MHGHRYLGGVIGSEAFEQQFLQQKVQDWISDLRKLLSHNLMQFILFVMAYHFGETIFWVCTSSSCLFQPLEDIIGSVFIPKLLGHDIPGKVECDLLSLPVRMGGLGLFIPTVTAARQHTCSQHTSSPCTAWLI